MCEKRGGRENACRVKSEANSSKRAGENIAKGGTLI